MQEIFVDDIRSIFVANGVVRIEFGCLKRGDGDDADKVSSETVATMRLPYNSLKNVVPRLAKALADVEIAMKKQEGTAGSDPASEAEDALSNL